MHPEVAKYFSKRNSRSGKIRWAKVSKSERSRIMKAVRSGGKKRLSTAK